MTSNAIEKAQQDLAFLRALAAEGTGAQGPGGAVLLAAGGAFGAISLIQWVSMAGIASFSTGVMIGLSGVAILVFLAVLSGAIVRHSRVRTTGGSARALKGAIEGGGLAIFITSLAFLFASLRAGDPAIWLFQPVVLAILQGAVWYVIYASTRRGWTGLVAFGWFVAGLALTVLLDSPHFMLVLALALFFLMALPGYAMTRAAKGDR